MRLPDGTGLDVIKAVKSNPSWRLTPVVVLSGEKSSQVVADTYAIGANCFLPKLSKTKTVFSMLRSLYDCWLDCAVLPEEAPTENQLQAILAQWVRNRARQANVYMSFSQAFVEAPSQSEFWLGRALNEGNFSNMAVFFQRISAVDDILLDDAERFAQMQSRVDAALHAAEQFLKENPRPTMEDCFAKALDILEAFDESVLSAFVRHILPRNPAAAKAVNSAAVDHLREVASFIGSRAELPSLRDRATALAAVADKLEATHSF
jgi:CheY-like chemotaxis protein